MIIQNYLLEKIRRRRLFSNLYSLSIVDKAEELWEEGDNILFSYSDNGIVRLVFSVTEWNALRILLSRLNGSYVIDYLTRDPQLLSLDGVLLARMKRLVNTDCRVICQDNELQNYRRDDLATIAKDADISEINTIFWHTFNHEISHLLSDKELQEIIHEGKITIHKSDRIDAVLQVEVHPKKFYINQIVNLGEKSIIHALLLHRLFQYMDEGGKYVYAWVDEKNIASLKFHGKYGMHHDGMWNLVWRIER